MKENKAISKIFDILEWIVTAGLLLLIILVGVQKFSEAGNFFGYRIYIVASGSMIPTYNIGDTLLVKEVPMDEFKIGDAVTYKGETAGVDGLVITHQVQKIEKDKKGQYLFHTKGVANNIEDPIVYEKQVLGKVTHKFLILSILGRIITNRLLLLLGIMLPMAFLVAVEIIKLVYKKDDEEFDKLLDVESEEDPKKEDSKKEEEKSSTVEEVFGEEVSSIEESKPAFKSETTMYRELVEKVRETVEKALEERDKASKSTAKKSTSNKKKYYQKNNQNYKQYSNNKNNYSKKNNDNKPTVKNSQNKKQDNKKKYYVNAKMK